CSQFFHYFPFHRLKNPRPKKGEAYVPTDVEHIANIITHGGCILPAIFAMLWMLYNAKTEVQFFIALLYGWALVALFSVSCTFHAICYTGKFRLTLRDFGGLEDEVLWLVWTMAIFGIFYQMVFLEKYKILEILIYLVVGVCPSVVACMMREPSGISELILGGITYVCGVVFFKSDGIIPFAHAIWHVFVFVGALFHYYAICTYLIGQEVDEITLTQ
ncbi:hypothetical protein FSP39_015989, partial [Pinctada imbricata]